MHCARLLQAYFEGRVNIFTHMQRDLDASLCCYKPSCLCRDVSGVVKQPFEPPCPTRSEMPVEMHFCNGPADSAAAMSAERK